jgi:release factor glutamine methyltransferase
MKTIKEVVEDYKELYKIYSTQETTALTLLVINEVTGLPKTMIKAFPERELTNQQRKKINDILLQLLTGKPIQYILGYAEFYGLKFIINPAVLIPRPETEEFVQWAVSSGQWAVGSGHILDIGTGSGCIAISLAKNLPGAGVSAIDISPEALQTAKQNAKLNEVYVNFIQVDILNTSAIAIPHSEIIISNPPYVTLADKHQMHTNVTDFEPHSALFVPEDDPLIFYKAIADFALTNLTPKGLLFFEINEGYGVEIIELLESKGFKNVELRKDMSGKDRMIKAQRRVSS